MRMYVLSFFVMLGLSACQAQSSENASGERGIQVISVADFRAKIKDKSVQLVDVRTPEEFAAGHIKGARNIDVQSADFESRAKEEISTKKPVAVYCRSGKRSQRAAETLSKMGYKVIYNMDGGFIAWEAAKQ